MLSTPRYSVCGHTHFPLVASQFLLLIWRNEAVSFYSCAFQTDLSDGDALKISISLGIASFPFFPQGAGEDCHDSLRLANRALQSARRVGMNAWTSIWGLAAKDSRSTATIAQAPLHAAQLSDSIHLFYRDTDSKGDDAYNQRL